MGEAQWALFVVASMAVILTPGQDTMLVLSRSIAQGPWAGFVTAAGVSAGLVGHTLLATFGLGAQLRAIQEEKASLEERWLVVAETSAG